MTTMTIRAAMVPVSQRVRAYFAPINRTTGAPSLFDPGKYGQFFLDAPPAPWLDLGWVENFQRFCATTTQPLRSGADGAPSSQFRGPLDLRVECEFREWGKLQMALACGSEHMNVLACNPNADPQPSGGTPITPVALLPGSSASQLLLGAGIASFVPGQVIAVDVDYQGQMGYVGTGISGAYVSDAADVDFDANYIRRVTYNVGRIAQITADSLLLTQPLLGGVPLSGASIQQVVAFVDREGGAFFQEWSALFILEEESGGRICFHYPRLSPTTAIERFMSLGITPSLQQGSAKLFQREEEVEITNPLNSLALRAAFQAMPHVDENDGQTVVCYRSYFPAAMASLY